MNGHQGFSEGADFFGADFGGGEELAHFGGGEEADFFDLAAGAGGVGLGGHPAEAEAAVEGGAEGDGEELPAGEEEVGFAGKPAVGGLDEEGVGDALDFAGHGVLVGKGADVFDDGIGEAEVEAVVAELAQVAGVAGDGDGVGEVFGGDKVEVQEGEMDGLGEGRGVAQPEAGGTADIEDAHGCGEGDEQFEEVLHALAAEARGERIWIGVVGEAGDHAGEVSGEREGGGSSKREAQSAKLKAEGKNQYPSAKVVGVMEKYCAVRRGQSS